MLAYPITLEDDDGTVLATSPDFPELTTFGDTREEAMARAVHALEEAMAARIFDRKDIPAPSLGEPRAGLPALTSVKVMLYQGMKSKASARRSWPGGWDGTCRRWTAPWTCGTGRGWTCSTPPSGHRQAAGRERSSTLAAPAAVEEEPALRSP